MAFAIQGKVALVTGGASGFGYHIIKHLFKNGLKAVMIADVDDVRGEATQKEFARDFGDTSCIFKKTNVANNNELEDTFKLAVEKFKQLDIVVNNAAIISEVDWKACLNVNLGGCVAGTKLAIDTYLPKYKSGNEGVIVNVASVAALQPIPMTPVYSATKHGILGLSRCYGAREHYENTKIKVITVCPGHMTTTMILTPNPTSYNTEYQKRFNIDAYLSRFPIQEADLAAQHFVDVVQNGQTGSVWVIENSKPAYEVEFKERFEMKKN